VKREPGLYRYNPSGQYFARVRFKGKLHRRKLVRTLPAPPHSRMNPDDIDTEAEDHLADSLRYALGGNGNGARYSEVGGL
jgi:hypothetical protein